MAFTKLLASAASTLWPTELPKHRALTDVSFRLPKALAVKLLGCAFEALTTELRDKDSAAELPEHRALTTALLTELAPTEVPEPAASPT